MFVGMLLLWILFNGRVTVEILLFGIVICSAICALLSMITNQNLFKLDLRMIKRFIYRLRYYSVLVVEIIKANLQVMDLILTPGEIENKPVLTEFKSILKHSKLNVLLANSITLTPGTITVDLDRDRFLVLALDESLAQDLDQSVFVKELQILDDRDLD